MEEGKTSIIFKSYVNTITDRKKFAGLHVLGHGNKKIFNHNMSYTVLLLILTMVGVLFKMDNTVYILGIILNFIFVIYFFNILIKKDLKKTQKRG